MFYKLGRLAREWSGLKAFRAIPRVKRQVVFYSEGAGYWTYFEPVVRALLVDNKRSVLYVTSSEDDPVLMSPPERLRVFYIGKGGVRTLFFATLDVDVLVMTMPDLQTFHIKRSPYPVHYSYLNHSMVSTHMVYRPEAFDHFDSVLCVGPHHVNEIRAREAIYGLTFKELVEHGYGRLDVILSKAQTGPLSRASNFQVIVAPSWGPDSLIELHGSAVIQPLLDVGLKVVLRPHPQTRRLNPKVLDLIAAEFAAEPLFCIDENGDAHRSLAESDIMISDWSGAALEFALGLERPVIFVDVPRKVLNDQYEEIDIEPLEVNIREEVGAVVAPADLPAIGSVAMSMVRNAEQWQLATQQARERWIFNVGRSGDVGAEFLLSLLSAHERSN